ncbi:MAG: phosphotransferase [Alphaproteobacteria bacterium]|nr:phosphotransferase [Alphaproteobacteria bacterium]
MADRDQIIAEFLQASGWDAAKRSSLAGDASARRYDRLSGAVLMDAPPLDDEDIGPFLKVARYLSECGLSAPEIYAADPQNGLIVMEDLGDDLYARVCENHPDQETELYEAAIDILGYLHRQSFSPDLPPYSAEIYQREADLLVDWYMPAITGQEVTTEIKAQYQKLINNACGNLSGPPVCVLRDYHAENLLWLPSREGVARVGLLDFQDALIGHPAYDLVSLLQDARRDTGRDLQAAMIARYLRIYPQNEDKFLVDYATLGAQRNLKIIGVFARLCIRDKKPAYVDLIPRVWAYLMGDLARPELAGLCEFMRDNVPPPTPQNLQKIREVA